MEKVCAGRNRGAHFLRCFRIGADGLDRRNQAQGQDQGCFRVPGSCQAYERWGKVKIEVVVTRDGRVKSTRVAGGHPLLVQACQDAVKQWKFAPASEETTQIVEFEFHPGN